MTNQTAFSEMFKDCLHFLATIFTFKNCLSVERSMIKAFSTLLFSLFNNSQHYFYSLYCVLVESPHRESVLYLFVCMLMISLLFGCFVQVCIVIDKITIND